MSKILNINTTDHLGGGIARIEGLRYPSMGRGCIPAAPGGPISSTPRGRTGAGGTRGRGTKTGQSGGGIIAGNGGKNVIDQIQKRATQCWRVVP